MIVGHEDKRRFLYKLAANEKVPSLLLFYGREGIGKKGVALEFAKQLPTIKESDIRIFVPETKSATFSTSQLSAIIEEAMTIPFEGRYKVLIIDEAHRIPPLQSNQLLKTLEEPLSSTKIILITAKPEKLLKTVRSRAISLSFSPLSDADLQNALIQLEISEEISQQLLGIANGSVTRGLLAVGISKTLQKLIKRIVVVEELELFSEFQEVEAELETWSDGNAFMLRRAQELVIEVMIDVLLAGSNTHTLKERAHASTLYEQSIEYLEYNPSFAKVLEGIFVQWVTGKSDKRFITFDQMPYTIHGPMRELFSI